MHTIQEKAHELESPILAMNSVPDHIHIAACIPPKLAIAEWVKQMKGASTRDVNAQFPDLETSFGWQQSYGVLTFGAKIPNLLLNTSSAKKNITPTRLLQPYLEQIDDET